MKRFTALEAAIYALFSGMRKRFEVQLALGSVPIEFAKIPTKSNINSLEHHGLNRCPDKGDQALVEHDLSVLLAQRIYALAVGYDSPILSI